MKKFEQELASIKQRVMDMGAVAETMVARASEALLSRDAASFPRCARTRRRSTAVRWRSTAKPYASSTIYTPTAKDLRFLLMVVRINTELERIGDQAVNNCEYAEMFMSEPPPRSLKDISSMADITVNMVRGALEAFAEEDVARLRRC